MIYELDVFIYYKSILMIIIVSLVYSDGASNTEAESST